ncbi:unnamed protein product [Sphacelaria rigidula]
MRGGARRSSVHPTWRGVIVMPLPAMHRRRVSPAMAHLTPSASAFCRQRAAPADVVADSLRREEEVSRECCQDCSWGCNGRRHPPLQKNRTLGRPTCIPPKGGNGCRCHADRRFVVPRKRGRHPVRCVPVIPCAPAICCAARATAGRRSHKAPNLCFGIFPTTTPSPTSLRDGRAERATVRSSSVTPG